MEIRPFSGAEADESQLRQCHELFVEHTRQTFPGFPVQPYESFAANMRRPRDPSLGLRHAWAAWGTGPDSGRILGFGTIAYPDTHMTDWAMPRVFVAETHWRRGVGTALLRELVADARAQGRTTLGNEQLRIGSEAEHWATALGFVNVQRINWQMLHIADVDPALWDVPVPAEFRLVQWADAAPDELVASFAEARNAIADAPHGDFSYREPEWTVERVRQAEARTREAGDDLRFVVAVHEPTGAVAALTGMVLKSGRVDLCWQRATAVVEAFRGRGLGRVVKAAMMRWLLAEIPDLARVVTTNAADNAHMIRINAQIGYTHYADIGAYEAPVALVQERLAARSGADATLLLPAPRREPTAAQVEDASGEPVG